MCKELQSNEKLYKFWCLWKKSDSLHLNKCNGSFMIDKFNCNNNSKHLVGLPQLLCVGDLDT